jgi:hypothetical protein
MEAPVVPTRLASTAPTASSCVFWSGVPARDPLRWTPPAMTNRVPSKAMKAAYSPALWVSQGVRPARQRPAATGTEKTAAMASLLRLLSQNRGRARGTSARAAR